MSQYPVKDLDQIISSKMCHNLSDRWHLHWMYWHSHYINWLSEKPCANERCVCTCVLQKMACFSAPSFLLQKSEPLRIFLLLNRRLSIFQLPWKSYENSIYCFALHNETSIHTNYRILLTLTLCLTTSAKTKNRVNFPRTKTMTFRNDFLIFPYFHAYK